MNSFLLFGILIFVLSIIALVLILRRRNEYYGEVSYSQTISAYEDALKKEQDELAKLTKIQNFWNKNMKDKSFMRNLLKNDMWSSTRANYEFNVAKTKSKLKIAQEDKEKAWANIEYLNKLDKYTNQLGWKKSPKCSPGCSNGQCVEKNGATICICNNDYTGETCSVKMESVDKYINQLGWRISTKCSPGCSNGGTCLEKGSETMCIDPWRCGCNTDNGVVKCPHSFSGKIPENANCCLGVWQCNGKNMTPFEKCETNPLYKPNEKISYDLNMNCKVPCGSNLSCPGNSTCVDGECVCTYGRLSANQNTCTTNGVPTMDYTLNATGPRLCSETNVGTFSEFSNQTYKCPENSTCTVTNGVGVCMCNGKSMNMNDNICSSDGNITSSITQSEKTTKKRYASIVKEKSGKAAIGSSVHGRTTILYNLYNTSEDKAKTWQASQPKSTCSTNSDCPEMSKCTVTDGVGVGVCKCNGIDMKENENFCLVGGGKPFALTFCNTDSECESFGPLSSCKHNFHGTGKNVCTCNQTRPIRGGFKHCSEFGPIF